MILCLVFGILGGDSDGAGSGSPEYGICNCETITSCLESILGSFLEQIIFRIFSDILVEGCWMSITSIEESEKPSPIKW